MQDSLWGMHRVDMCALNVFCFTGKTHLEIHGVFRIAPQGGELAGLYLILGNSLIFTFFHGKTHTHTLIYVNSLQFYNSCLVFWTMIRAPKYIVSYVFLL